MFRVLAALLNLSTSTEVWTVTGAWTGWAIWISRMVFTDRINWKMMHNDMENNRYLCEVKYVK